MFGEVEGSRSFRWPRAEPRGISFTLREFEGSAFLSRRPSAIDLQFCSSHQSSRISSNSLKTKDGCHGYPSQNREGNLHAFFAAPIGSKLARENSGQESRSRWLAHHSR